MKVMCVNSSLNAGKLNLKSFQAQEPDISSEPIKTSDKKMLSYDKSYYMNNSANINFKRVTKFPILNDAEAKSLIQTTIAKVEKLDDKRLVKYLKKCMDNLSQYGAEYYYSNRRKDHRNVRSIKLFSIQAINKLIDHPITQIDSIRNELYHILCDLTNNEVYGEMLKSEQLLDFADFLVSEEAKPLREHPSVQKNAHKLFEYYESPRSIDDKCYLICRHKVAEEMVKSPELFDDKDFDFADFMYQICGIDSYKKIYITSCNAGNPRLNAFRERIEALRCGVFGIKENDCNLDKISKDLDNRLLDFKKKQTADKK